MSAEKVSDMLDRLYLAFDALADRHGVYKIDTIGDGEHVSLSAMLPSNHNLE